MDFAYNMEYDLFLRCLTECPEKMDETDILFLDDMERGACILGYIPYHKIKDQEIQSDRPYWIGTGCDVKDGAEFLDAEELLQAKVYGGKSIKEAWNRVCVLTLGGMPIEWWMQLCPFREEVTEEEGIWRLI